MDFPVFHLDLINNRMLIAVIAILHVLINHTMAVGGIPFVVWLERKGLISGDDRWDKLAFRIMTVFFIITTTVGALTGVGIWISASLISPYSIGSLLRVFFWTWFVEWIIFFTEVVLILWYYLSWKRLSGPHKARHVRLGWSLAVASWITMVLIVSILAFMMDPGSWLSDRTLFSGMLNPVYLPQLAFRTSLAMVLAGTAALLLIPVFTRKDRDFRLVAVRAAALWIMGWMPLLLAGGAWYAHAVPAAMVSNVTVALLTQGLAGWERTAYVMLGLTAGAIVVIAAFAAWKPGRAHPLVLALPVLLGFGLMAHFERVREFIRKPYAIAGYLYSNGFRPEEYPLLKRDGLLKHATYTSIRTITDENQLEAGREVFRLACTRCHTVDGVNGIKGNLTAMYGTEALWDAKIIASYIDILHNARSYMPPFPGNAPERDALAAYLQSLQGRRDFLDGDQTVGVPVAPKSVP